MGAPIECITISPGLHIAILVVEKRICPRIGSLGRRCVGPGIHSYVGSAKGPGGLRSRIARHAAKEKRRWYIDYITSNLHTDLGAAICVETRSDLEGELARILEALKCREPRIEGFGSSDGDSSTHLFWCGCYLEECSEEILRALEERLGRTPGLCRELI